MTKFNRQHNRQRLSVSPQGTRTATVKTDLLHRQRGSTAAVKTELLRQQRGSAALPDGNSHSLCPAWWQQAGRCWLTKLNRQRRSVSPQGTRTATVKTDLLHRQRGSTATVKTELLQQQRAAGQCSTAKRQPPVSGMAAAAEEVMLDKIQ